MRYVCCADLHLRPDKPLCRAESADEWVDTQLKKLSFILEFADKKHATVLMAGDICHRATGWPSWMFWRVINVFNKWSNVPIFVIPGQHDLPYHQLNQLHRSNLGVLLEAGVVWNCANHVVGFAWGEKIQKSQKKAHVAVAHLMVLKDPKDATYPGQAESATMAEKLLKQFPQYDLIVTGDNHQPFVEEYKGRWLVNPGSMTRQRTTETHAPGFYYYEDGQVERVEPPYNPKAVIDTSKEELAAAWAGNLEAVGELLDAAVDGDELDFRSALETYFRKRKTRAEVQRKILGE